MFQRDLDEGFDPANADETSSRACCAFRGWGARAPARAPIAARYIDELRDDIEAMGKALPPKYAYVHGVRDVEKPRRT